MPDINDLRRARAEVNEQVQALAALENEGTELTAEQLEEFTALQTQFDALSAKIERAEAAEKMAAVGAKPVVGSNGNKVFAEPKQPAVKGGQVARMLMAMGASGGRGGRDAAHYAETTFGDADVSMALNTTVDASGGVLVPQAFMGDLIELLTPRSVVRSLNPMVLPMPHGNLSIPSIVGGATSNYTAEGDDIEVSEQQFGDVQLTAKDLTTMVPVANQLLNYAGTNPNIETAIVNDMLNSMGLREDIAFIRGDGTDNTPTGIRNLIPAGNQIAASDGSTVQKVLNDLGKAELALRAANVRMINVGWILSPRSYMFLKKLVDGNGNKVFPEMADMMLGGYPFRVTSQVPDNLGAGTESEITLCDFADAVIGEAEGMTVAISTEASYKDPATGNLVSAFSKNQTLIRVVAAHDFGMRHKASAAVLTGVTWGA